MAYIAPPASSDGWVAWGINPTSVGMVGTQALIALKQSDGSMTVKTFNLKSYASIQEGAISFNVSDVSAEYSGGNMTIFATWALPTKTTEVNQVWQVGPAVTNGQPARHDTKPENLASTGKLKLLETASPPVESPKGSSGGKSSGTPPAAADEKSNAGDSRMRMKNLGFYGLLVSAALFA
ncbi:hypothetical protein Nepgr_004297 [Nepenthes gracilis]|uniref:DOMON domain-containing protein n=1 Tax=Nepenthes gracilis TaxID=150966 RepID=A0AAD3XEY5_NEPGR|nr:hypothetical protein Nepgr_004297 [Nepenthes gracilis]